MNPDEALVGLTTAMSNLSENKSGAARILEATLAGLARDVALFICRDYVPTVLHVGDTNVDPEKVTFP